MTRKSLPSAVQERSRQKIQHIIAAGLNILENGGASALTIAAVAREASVAVGSVYQRFGTKDQLLAEIQNQFTENFLAEFKSRMMTAELKKNKNPVDLVTAAVTAFCETFQAHAKLMRVFVLLGAEIASVREVGARVSKLCRGAFGDLLVGAQSAIGRANPEEAKNQAYRLVYSSCIYQVVYGGEYEEGSSTSWKMLAEQLSQVVTLYLFADDMMDSC